MLGSSGHHTHKLDPFVLQKIHSPHKYKQEKSKKELKGNSKMPFLKFMMILMMIKKSKPHRIQIIFKIPKTHMITNLAR